VSSAGFNCKRADNLFGHNILNDIWLAINRAEVIIADITSRNPNVFYEIGIAHTIGKKVILLSQKKEDIPFDFLHYRHILYEDNTDGIKLLENLLPKFLNETTERK
jgi:nucleoside 2-deoxyribosyltransferase